MREASGLKTLYVSTSKMLGDTAVWTQTYTSDRLIYSADTTDEVAKLYIPIEVDLLNDDTVGSKYSADAKIEKIELEYFVGTAALDAEVVAEIHSQAIAVDGAAPVVDTVACTVAAAGTITATLDQDDHLITITPDAAVALNGTKSLRVEVAFDKATTSTVVIYGARVYFRENLA